MQLPDFGRLFEDGGRLESDFGPVTLSRHPVGRLVLTSGEVVACDPATGPADTAPFTLTLPPGEYAVTLGVAHFDDGDQRVAGAMLSAAEPKAARWVMALLPEQDLAELKEGEVFGYPVDSGTGCFMDAEAAREYTTLWEADETMFDRIAEEMDKTYVDTWSWANIELDPATGLNLVTFSAGLGDGLYASYFGLDEGDGVVALVTDFALFDHAQMT